MTSQSNPPQPDDVVRRHYWTEHMEGNYVLLQTMANYPIEETHEPLAPITTAADDARVEMAFSDTKIAGDLDRIFAIRTGLIPNLMEVARQMNERGWILKIEDGFRTREMQGQLVLKPTVFEMIVRACQWEHGSNEPPFELLQRRATCLVANYPYSGTHTMGAAVDISVLHREDGSEIWRGHPYLEMSVYTPMESPFVDVEYRRNRQAITTIMEQHGFLHYPGEFWHYNKGDALFHLRDAAGTPACYGPVHWDPATSMVTPYDNMTSPLVPPDVLAQHLELALDRLAIDQSA